MENKLKIVLIIVVLFIISIIINSLLKSNIEETKAQRIQEPYKILTCEDKCDNGQSCLSACYELNANIAVAKKDSSLCNNILDEKVKQDCKDRVNLSKAISEKKSSLCDEIINANYKSICQSNAK